MLTAVKHPVTGELICSECFNKLPEDVRGGRAAREAGWVPDDAEIIKCPICGKDMYLIPGTID